MSFDPHRRHSLKLAGASLLSAALGFDAAAQSFPSKPIKVLYPYAPGSSIEQGLRVIAGEASKLLGQPVVIEARPGANGMIGLNALKQARGDAHLLALMNNGTLVYLPLTSASTRIDPRQDYVPVTLALRTNLVFVVHPSAPFRDVQGLIAYARANPGKLDCAVVGTASNTHLALELLKYTAGVDIRNVPYKGEGQALPDVLGGTVPMGIASSIAKQHVDAGRLIAIAMTGPERWNMFPAVPTMKEAGVANYAVFGWFGLLAPPGTPQDVVATLNSAFTSAMNVPAVRKTVTEDLGLDLLPSQPGQVSDLIKADLERWEPVIRKAGIKID